MLVLKAIRHHFQNNDDKPAQCLWHQEMQTQVGNGMLLAKWYHTHQMSNWRGLCLEVAHKSFLEKKQKQKKNKKQSKHMKRSCFKRTFKNEKEIKAIPKVRKKNKPKTIIIKKNKTPLVRDTWGPTNLRNLK